MPSKIWKSRGERFAPTAEYLEALDARRDAWVPASGGREEPTFGFLYVYNPGLRKHGWLDLATDIVQFDSPYTRS